MEGATWNNWAADWSCASVGGPDNTLAEPHPNSNTQQSKNNTMW